MPRSRSRSPRGIYTLDLIYLCFFGSNINLDRYGSSRYRGGGPLNSASGRRRHSRSRSRSPRDRERDGRKKRTII